MVRYSGQPLPDRPRIAVFANDAIGNFVMATPLLQLLKQERNPGILDYYGGTRTRELQDASDLFDNSYCLHGAALSEFRGFLERAGTYDLLINLESTAYSKTAVGLLAGEEGLIAGPCIAPGGRGDLPFSNDTRGELWRDKSWASPHMAERYPFLKSGFISEIFSRLCYLGGDLPPYRVAKAEPNISVPEILVATAASLPEKLWDYGKWACVLRELRRAGLGVGLLGAPPKAQAEHWQGASSEESLIGIDLAEDLRGKLTLPEVVGALARAKLALTLDNGILHLAVAAGIPTIGIYRHGIHHLWAPPARLLTVLTPGEGREVLDLAEDEVLDAVWRRLGEAS